MKYKILSLVVILSMIIGTVAFQNFKLPNNRYHQHLDAAEKEQCEKHDEKELCTHLPLICVSTEADIPYPYVTDENGNVVYKEDGRDIRSREFVYSTVDFINSKYNNNHMGDTPEVSEKAEFRIRGNSSRRFDKKSYLIKFVDKKNNMNKNVPLDGMVADDSWVLHGPFLDKTLIRNYMCNNIVAEIEGYAPNVRFCELVLNGEYQGVYVLTEKINYNNNGRVNIAQSNVKAMESSYILRFDGAETDELHTLVTFADDSGKRGVAQRHNEKLEIMYPGNTLTELQKRYIEYDISAFEKLLTSKESLSKSKYKQYIDVQSFVNYYVLSEFFMNFDAGKRSTYVIKDVRGKIEMAGWDYNNVFNNYFNDLSNPQRFYVSSTWYDQLLKDPYFVKQVNKTYKELRKTYLSDEYLLNYIDETVEYLGPAIERNNKKWGYSFEKDFIYDSANSNQVLNPKNRNVTSYDEAIQQLKDAIVERGKFLDENIQHLYYKAQVRREQ